MKLDTSARPLPHIEWVACFALLEKIQTDSAEGGSEHHDQGSLLLVRQYNAGYRLPTAVPTLAAPHGETGNRHQDLSTKSSLGEDNVSGPVRISLLT